MSEPISARLVVLDTRTGSLAVDKLVFIDGDPAETMARYTAQYPDEHHKLFAISASQPQSKLPPAELAACLTEMLESAPVPWTRRLRERLRGLFTSAEGAS